MTNATVVWVDDPIPPDAEVVVTTLAQAISSGFGKKSSAPAADEPTQELRIETANAN